MKGVVFTMFNQFVEEKFGMDVWEDVLNQAKPPSEGIYTSGETYPDQEMLSLLSVTSDTTGVEVGNLLSTFGEFALGYFSKHYPKFFEMSNAKQFLLQVHDVIHVEVKKLYPDILLPHIQYEDSAPNQLVMIYKSPRKLCRFAEGLIIGTAKHYSTPIEQTQTICALTGADHCRFELHFGEPTK